MTLTGSVDLGVITPVVVTTDGDGFYQFANLRPGTYTVTQGAVPGYLPGLNTRGNAAPLPGSVGSDAIAAVS